MSEQPVHTRLSGKCLPAGLPPVVYQVECWRGRYQATFISRSAAYAYAATLRGPFDYDARVVAAYLVKGEAA